MSATQTARPPAKTVSLPTQWTFDEEETMVEPVVKTVVVPIAPESAFRLFTESMALWWPLGSHSVFGAESVSVTFDPRVGGQLTETSSAGQHSVWGSVTAWAPPDSVSFTWHAGRDPKAAQQVAVTFTVEAPGTRVRLEHTGWEVLGDDAEEVRGSYDDGWDRVFMEAYGGAARWGG